MKTTEALKDASSKADKFQMIAKAYHHLMNEHGGNQRNPSHNLQLMLSWTTGAATTTDDAKDENAHGSSNHDDDDCFKARLLAVLLEYGTKGLDLSNAKKKWKQVWPDTPFPNAASSKTGKPLSLTDFIVERAGDVIYLEKDDKGCVRVHTSVGIAKSMLISNNDECVEGSKVGIKAM
jgi:hypothetical protein